jgi:hypothetical protein
MGNERSLRTASSDSRIISKSDLLMLIKLVRQGDGLKNVNTVLFAGIQLEAQSIPK